MFSRYTGLGSRGTTVTFPMICAWRLPEARSGLLVPQALLALPCCGTCFAPPMSSSLSVFSLPQRQACLFASWLPALRPLCSGGATRVVDSARDHHAGQFCVPDAGCRLWFLEALCCLYSRFTYALLKCPALRIYPGVRSCPNLPFRCTASHVFSWSSAWREAK